MRALGLRGVNMCSDPQDAGCPELGEPAVGPVLGRVRGPEMPVNFHIGASDTSMSWFGTSPWPSLDDGPRSSRSGRR